MTGPMSLVLFSLVLSVPYLIFLLLIKLRFDQIEREPRRKRPIYCLETAGNIVKCSLCNNAQFHPRRAKLNTKTFTSFGLDYMNKNADLFVCTSCNKIIWIGARTKRVGLTLLES